MIDIVKASHLLAKVSRAAATVAVCLAAGSIAGEVGLHRSARKLRQREADVRKAMEERKRKLEEELSQIIHANLTLMQEITDAEQQPPAPVPEKKGKIRYPRAITKNVRK